MAASDASKHDLTSELGKFLDRHLVFPLLEFLQAKKVYPEAEILEAKIALLQKTNMLDFAADIYKSLHNAKDVPPEMTKRREEVRRLRLDGLHVPLLEEEVDDAVATVLVVEEDEQRPVNEPRARVHLRQRRRILAVLHRVLEPVHILHRGVPVLLEDIRGKLPQSALPPFSPLVQRLR